ncbi:MAG: hypothetical protein ABH824_07745 [Nanoarchaeota archaeon]|nr:hypothetical protein [Nanoarchaeota archaeon]MBU1631626.1 hypothetical protein [Nanoarchaeota archaeon]MBU1876621.1 hypothetical protein [Nanoarchaeota archaeon]
MIKDWKSATGWGILLWLLIFVEMSILMFIPRLKDMLITQKILHFLILPLLVIFCVSKYFKKVKANTKEGFLIGVYFLIVGTILDLAITIPLFVKSFSSFYLEWSLWTGFLELIIFSTATGYWLGKNREK